jgi:hypothetical protein
MALEWFAEQAEREAFSEKSAFSSDLASRRREGSSPVGRPILSGLREALSHEAI